jgi:hypothetical protein
VRLSRGRVLLRSALLFAGGGFMLWRAREARGLARLLQGADALLTTRIALVEALVGALAVLTGLAALLSLRSRPRRQTLQLEGGAPPAGERRPGRSA